jgi:hypothetical protein
MPSADDNRRLLRNSADATEMFSVSDTGDGIAVDDRERD